MNARKLIAWALGPAMIALAATAPARADLEAYLQREDPSFRWTAGESRQAEQGETHDLEVVSQTWHDIVWKHNVRVYTPRKIDHPGAMLLFITGGSHESKHDEGDDALAFAMAEQCGARVVVLPQVPNQPLLGDKREDELIAETFVRYLETGDATWPLLFPMVKSVVRGMDALQEWARDGHGPEIEKFVVTGASKRGWTTWLTGATDRRVVGIAPMVIDVLDFPAQKAGWARAYGGPSEAVSEYTDRGLIDLMDRPEGKRLWALVDPILRRDRLTMPKLIILGTNDPFWTVDALNLYWEQLQGPKSVVYLPNAGHGLDQHRPYALQGVGALFRNAVVGQPISPLEWKFEETDEGVVIEMTPPAPPRSVKVWIARSDTLDFRGSRWEASEIEPTEGVGRFTVAPPLKGHVALFGDVELEGPGGPFHLSTQIRVISPKKP